ncbi:hypothetical protein C5S39_14625 [Candidatus Methanophagaceae archaeon]|nr:hypothetical protein C5S39_14625 [Methanophagales archaeon]
MDPINLYVFIIHDVFVSGRRVIFLGISLIISKTISIQYYYFGKSFFFKENVLCILEAVQQSKIARKRKVYSALNPKRRRKNGVKINCGTASLTTVGK